jgi:hypothetical protein
MARKSVSFAQFFHRVNADGTIDAICGYCLSTAATANTQTEIRLLQSAHHCGHSRNTPARAKQSAPDTKNYLHYLWNLNRG